VHSLKLKNQAEWTAMYKSPDFPEDIPASPSRVYKNEGWISFGDWLGTGVIATNYQVYKDFKEVKKYVKTLGLKTIKEWIRFCESGKKPVDIPRNVQRTYSSEWKGWSDFLGKE
jgi:hypothetical protein